LICNIADYVKKQLKLQKLQSSIDEQERIRNEIQQLEQYIEPKTYHQRDTSSKLNETKQELDLTKDRLLEIVNEIDEEIVDASERNLRQHSFNKSKDYREENDSD
jgi:hypothetical protein